MPIFEFACQDGHEFQIWSDSARLCPTCGSEFLKRIFKTAPMINTPKTKALDNLVRNELERQGITNIQGGGHEGEREKITRKSTPEELAADKIMADFPQMKDKNEIQKAQEWANTKWGGLNVKQVIKSGLGNTPDAAMTRGLIQNVGKRDKQLIPNRQFIKHPEDMKKAG